MLQNSDLQCARDIAAWLSNYLLDVCTRHVAEEVDEHLRPRLQQIHELGSGRLLRAQLHSLRACDRAGVT